MVELKEYELMFEYNPLAQAIIDKDLKFLKVNSGFVKLFGYSGRLAARNKDHGSPSSRYVKISQRHRQVVY